MAAKVTGPAFYFPSIEAKYGRKISEWKELMRATGLRTSGDLVAWLKREHGMGHGHAMALAGDFLDAGVPPASAQERVDRLFPPAKAHWRPVYDALTREIHALGEVRVLPKDAAVGFATAAQFALLQPSTPQRFDVGVKLPGVAATSRLEPAGSWGGMMTHRVRITAPEQIDAELLSWLRQAYQGVV